MDKYERKQLRKRDEKLGKLKDKEKLSFYMVQHQKKLDVYNQLREYSGRVVPNFVAFCLEEEEKNYLYYHLEQIWQVHYGFREWGMRYLWRRYSFGIGLSFEDTDGDYLGGERDILTYCGLEIDVKRSIKKGKAIADKRLSMMYACEFVRTKHRMKQFRDELLVECDRRRAIQNFKMIEEELIAAAWHPRRIERLLELGGEAALDNFAGL